MTSLAALSDRIDRWPGAARAAFWMVIIGTLITLTLVCVRKVTPGVHVFEIVFFRSIFGVAVVGPWMARRGLASLKLSRPGLMALRATLAFIGSVCLFWAATLLPLADVTAITFSRPIVAAIAAIVFLHEVVGPRRWAAIIVGIIGALIIVRPGMEELNLGVLLVFGTVAAQTWNVVNLKVLTRTEKPDAMALWHLTTMIPLGLAASLFVWRWPTIEALGWMAAIGVLEMLAQRAMSRAYAAADTTVVLAFSFTRLPVAALLGFVLFGEVPVIWVWVGAAIITASSVYITHRESVGGRGKKAPAK